MNELLPMGTIVKIEGSLFVVAGYNVVSDGKFYEYVAFPYPVGLHTQKGELFFNKNIIEEVVFEGYKFKNFDIAANNLINAKNKIIKMNGE